MKKGRKIHTASFLWQRVALVLFGVLLALALLEIGLQTSGFLITLVQQYKNEAALKKGDAYRIMCVGESTTQGQYPRFLEKILNARQTQMRFSVIDQGLSATDTNVILEKMEDRIKAYRPDAVVAMIGINDEGARHMPAGFTTSRRNFVQSFKTYRLLQLLFMHIQARLGEMKGAVSGKLRSETSSVAPRDDAYFMKLGMELHAQNKIQETKAAFREALRLNPGNTDAYFRLMWLHDPEEQETMIQKMVEKYSREFTVCRQEDTSLAYLFTQLLAMHKYVEAETLLKVLRSHCRAGWISFFSAETAAGQGRYQEAVTYYEESIKHNKSEGHETDRRPYLGLAYVYRALGKHDLTEVYLAQARAFVPDGYAARTVDNYRKIHKMLDEQGIRLICVQYPMRDIEPLKRIFPEAHNPNISFVDNEKSFKDALKKYRFEDIFVDRFAGDFGHCTDLGNDLLAKQIATVILKEVLRVK